MLRKTSRSACEPDRAVTVTHFATALKRLDDDFLSRAPAAHRLSAAAPGQRILSDHHVLGHAPAINFLVLGTRKDRREGRDSVY